MCYTYLSLAHLDPSSFSCSLYPLVGHSLPSLCRILLCPKNLKKKIVQISSMKATSQISSVAEELLIQSIDSNCSIAYNIPFQPMTWNDPSLCRTSCSIFHCKPSRIRWSLHLRLDSSYDARRDRSARRSSTQFYGPLVSRRLYREKFPSYWL